MRARPEPGPWKARHVAAWIGQTPFVWLEDDFNVAGCLTEEPGLGRHLVVRTDPAVGVDRAARGQGSRLAHQCLAVSPP